MINILIYVVAIFVLFWSAYPLYILLCNIEKAKNWVPIDAKLIDLRAVKKDLIKGKKIKKTIIYFFCSYEVNGRLFGLNKFSLYPKTNGHERLYMEKIQNNERVTIYVNQEQPHIGTCIKPSEHSCASSVIKLFFFWTVIFSGMYFYLR